ncbi:twin-arginine translocase subunit TatB, partial [Enterobacteriaceae bacterium TzEc077]
MLDVGMTELLCFAIIAILVLGPEKLPEAARFAGRWYVRLKRYITNLQNEIDQELRLSEFRKEMQEELNRIEALERKVQQQLDEIQKQQVSESLEVTETAKTTQKPIWKCTPISGHYKVPYLTKVTSLAAQTDIS